jgi:hypothetical protein
MAFQTKDTRNASSSPTHSSDDESLMPKVDIVTFSDGMMNRYFPNEP